MPPPFSWSSVRLFATWHSFVSPTQQASGRACGPFVCRHRPSFAPLITIIIIIIIKTN
jgi:hypothetical protein